MRKLIVIMLLVSISYGDTFTSHIKPTTDNTLDVGTVDTMWRTGRFYTITDGTASITGGLITGATGSNLMWINDAAYITLNSLSATAPIVHTSGDFSLDYDANDFTVSDGTLTISESGVDHGTLSGLADDDHTQYLLATGARDLTGDWTVSANSVTLTAGTLTAATITDGNATLTGGNITSMGNITGSDSDVNLGTGDFITTGTLGAGAITGSSYTISLDTLGSTEWSNLVGLNQSLSTSDAPSFATGVTIGNLTLANGSITDSGSNISFGSTSISTTTGNVGIGTTPSYPIHVVLPSGIYIAMFEGSNSGANNSFIVRNSASENTANECGIRTQLETTGGATRTCLELKGSFNPIDDGTRQTQGGLYGQDGGAFTQFLAFNGADVFVPNGNLRIGDSTTPVYDLEINSVLSLVERSTDPAEPAEGKCIIWLSDGTGYGDDGDVCIASQAGGTTNKAILFDHSAGVGW